MRKAIFIIAAVICMATLAVAQEEIPSAQPGVQYGKAISKDGAISIARLEGSFGADSAYTGKITGEVVAVCKKKGCFVQIKREGEGAPVMVRFKDYGFFMPQDIVGKTVVLEGKAKVKEISVAALRHYAEDEGKSAEEIAKITEPKVDITIIADGVVVVK